MRRRLRSAYLYFSPSTRVRANGVGSDFSELLGFFIVPVAVKSVLPEGTGMVVSVVGIFAVNALEFVQTRFASLGLESGGVGFFVGLAALCHVAVVFQFVGAAAFLALGAVRVVCKCCVSPFPAVVALGDTGVHRGSSDCGYVSAEVEGPINKGFSLGTIL